MSQRHYLLNTTLPTSDLQALRQGVNAGTAQVVEVAECVYTIPLPWLACFRQADLRPCVVEMAADSVEIMAPVVDVPTAIANLEGALPLFEAFTGEQVFARAYWQSALDELKTLPLPYLTLNISEMLMNMAEEDLIAHLSAALGRNAEALAVVKQHFAEYDDKALPYPLDAFYANAGITDQGRIRNTVAMNMAITSGMAWTRQVPRVEKAPTKPAPPAPLAQTPAPEQAGLSARDMYGRAYALQDAGDYVQAVHWYRQAIEAADASGTQSPDMFVNGSAAACNLADKYEHGLGVPQDYRQALAWYSKSAAKGNCVAQYSLGMMHKQGLGVPANNAEALGWFQKSARQGYADAAKELALLSTIALKERPTEKSGFAAGTLVHTKEGLKPIEQIQVGDWLLSFPEDQPIPQEYRQDPNPPKIYKRVVQTFVTENQPVTEFPVTNYASGIHERFTATPNHPIYVKDRGWITLEAIYAGRKLVAVENHYFGNLMLGGLSKDKGLATVYSIEVEDFHTYYVGKEGMWVHT